MELNYVFDSNKVDFKLFVKGVIKGFLVIYFTWNLNLPRYLITNGAYESLKSH